MVKARVGDLMSEDIVKIKENATIKDAAHILLRFQINGLLVIEEQGDEVVGVLTTTDLLRLIDRALSRHIHKKAALENMAHMRVSEVTSKNILKVQKGALVGRVISLMHRKRVHTIPVYDGKKLVGVIGKHDILNAAFSSPRA